MRKPKFKVGDKVKVLRASIDEEKHLWCDIWVGISMDIMIGIEDTITYIYTEGDYDSPSYSFGGYIVPEFVLQKVNEVGKQLLFSFMEQYEKKSKVQ